MVTVSLRGFADHHLVEPRSQPGDHVVDHGLGDERAADARAPLSRLGGDLSSDLLDVEVEFRCPVRGSSN
jgi:hypothetical protein